MGEHVCAALTRRLEGLHSSSLPASSLCRVRVHDLAVVLSINEAFLRHDHHGSLDEYADRA